MFQFNFMILQSVQKKLTALVIALIMLNGPFFCFAQKKDTGLIDKLLALTPKHSWVLKDSIPLKFNAGHTQGMVKIGAFYYMSSVEVSEWPKSYKVPQGKYDRSTGRGRGHLFKFDEKGNLLKDVIVGEGDIYHPGGIDFDGKYIWISVAEYRPNSMSIVYRLDPQRMELTEVLRYPEHIGAVIHNTDDHSLVGASWGARRFYKWRLNSVGKVINGDVAPEKLGVENPSFYVDFQDCKYLGNNLMLGSGMQTFKRDTVAFKIGGWEIFDLTDFRAKRQIPINIWSHTGASMLNNPAAVESTNEGIRAYFVPDDDVQAVLYVYDAIIPNNK